MDVRADSLLDWATTDELKNALHDIERPVLMIGGGSNLLFMGDFKGTVLHSTISSIDIIGAMRSRCRLSTTVEAEVAQLLSWSQPQI